LYRGPGTLLTPRTHIATTLSGSALRFEAVWWTTMPNGLSGRPVFALPGASTSFIKALL